VPGVAGRLVHLYLDIEDAKVFETLEQLDHIRAFAAAVQLLLDEASGSSR
jgi:uncharacterized protein YutE (UPF0331/DUF86 family)